MKAIWNDTVVAESNATIIVENNYYFPANSIKTEYFKPSSKSTHCPWKGDAAYYNIDIGGVTNPDAAWYYPSASEKAKAIEGYVAFWKGVTVTET